MRPAPVTFDTKLDATAWLARQQDDVNRGLWQPPVPTPSSRVTLRTYADGWLADRDVKPSTRALYRDLLDQHILPALGDLPVATVAPTTVRAWYATLDPAHPTRRAHAYSLLRSIMRTAVDEELRESNPCRIRGAGSSKRHHDPRPATLPELEAIVAALPARYRAMALLAAWCALRFGELTELRRADVDLEGRVLRVRRGVTRVDGAFVVGDPKSEAGKRTVAIPPHLIPVVEQHLQDHVGTAPSALLFPARNGGHMRPSALQTVYYRARAAAGRPDLHFHDLRHTGATLAAATGATLAELMARLGHSTPAAAMRYQHAAADRDRAIAEALSGFAGSTVIPLRRVSAKK